MSGQVLLADRFRLDEQLHEAGGIVTWLGVDEGNQKPVVAKRATGPDAQLRLAQEAEALRRVASSHVPRLVHHSADLLVTAKVEGNSLRERLRRGPLSVEETLRLGVGLFQALVAIHDSGMLHRDVKPENVVVQGEPLETAVLVDFGLAGASMHPSEAGTLLYMAPERLGALGQRPDSRSDLYSAAMVLFESLTGLLPFPEVDLSGLLRTRLTAKPRAASDFRADSPPALDELLGRLLRTDPDDRYQQASAVVDDLQELLRGGAPVVGATDRRKLLTDPAFVGREKELASLVEWSSLEKSRLLRLEGTSGAGKTRLLEEFSRRAAADGHRVVWGRATREGSALPYQQLEQVVDQVAGHLSREPGLVTAVQSYGPTLATAFSSLAPFFAPVPTEDPLLVAVLVEFLALLPGTWVFILDDCQWADTATVAFLEQWQARETPTPSRVVAALRSEEVGAPAFEGDRTVRLAPLARSEVFSLLESMAGVLPIEAAERIWLASRGDPFMAEATLRGLVEEGVLISESGAWELLGEATPRVSLRAAVLMSERLNRLSAPAQDMLEAAALLGRDFDLELLAALLNSQGPEMFAALEEARRNHLLVDVSPVRWTFAHDRIREAALARLEADRRADLHLRAARYLELHRPQRVFEIAHHFSDGGRCDLAFVSAVAGAREAQSRYAGDSALRCCDIALQHRPADCELLVAQGQALAHLGRHTEAERAFLKAEKLAATREMAAEIQIRLADLYVHWKVGPASRRASEKALAYADHPLPIRKVPAILLEWARHLLPRKPSTAQPVAEADLLSRLFTALALSAMLTDDVSTLMWGQIRQINLLERYPPGRALATAYADQCCVFCIVGAYRLAAHFERKALEFSRKSGDRWSLAAAKARTGWLPMCLGRVREAADTFTQSIRLFPSDYSFGVLAGKTHVAHALYCLGEFREAERIARQTLRLARQRGDHLHISSNIRLVTLASCGNLPAASDSDPPPEGGSVATFLHHARGVAALYGDHPERAVLPLTRAVAESRAFRAAFHTSIVPGWLATALRMTGETLPLEGDRLARQFYRKARRAARLGIKEARYGRIALPHALRELGLLEALRGRTERAQSLLEHSVAEARTMELRYDLAWSLIELARLVADPALEAEGRAVLADIGARLPGEDPPPEPETLFSLQDRFQQVLEVGRRIASCLDRQALVETLTEAGRSLLRLEEVLVVSADDQSPSISSALREQALQKASTSVYLEGETPSLSESLLLDRIRSALCTPVVAGGKVELLLYGVHRELGRLFGDEELRLADYLATLAGAALENIAGFQERCRAEERLRTLFLRTGVGTALLDSDGRLEEANPFLSDLLGIPTEELVGTNLGDYLYYQDRPVLSSALAGGIPQGRAEVRYLRRPAQVLWAQMLVTRLTGEGAIVVLVDISHRRTEQMLRLQETERRLVASELHDTVSQPVAALYYQLQANPATEEVAGVCQGVLKKMGRLMNELRNPVLEEVDGADELVRDFSRRTGLEVAYHREGEVLLGLEGITCYRALREALTNVHRHAGASRVEVELRVRPDQVVARIADDGVGFDPRRLRPDTYGLRGLRERVELLGGEVSVRSKPGGGTEVVFCFPRQEVG